SRPARIHFTARFLTATRQTQGTVRKPRASCRGSRKHIRARLFPRARTDGSRSAKAIGRFMRNGKTPDLSGPIIGNTFLETNVQNPISTRAQVSMFRQPCETIWE